MEIFIKKTNNPEIFLKSIVPLIETVKDSINEPSKNNFIEK